MHECRAPGVDFVIGSRYVRGGSIDPTWSMFRRWNSRIASLLARGLTAVRDPMAGYFALKQSTFARAAELRPMGYKIGLELIVRCDCGCVREVPIDFQDRVCGESKLSLAQQWLYLRHLGRLYAAKYFGQQRDSQAVPAPAASSQAAGHAPRGVRGLAARAKKRLSGGASAAQPLGLSWDRRRQGLRNPRRSRGPRGP